MLSARGRRVLSSRLEKYTDCVERLYQAIRESTGSRVIVDSSKVPAYGYVLGMTPGIDLYVVHLVRDPRAAAYSWLREKPQLDTDKPTHMLRMSTAKSSLLWDAWNASSEALWRGSYGQYMRLRYEDFVEDPQRALKDISDMLQEDVRGLAFVEGRDVELGASHTASGNPNRFQTGTVRLRPDNEWASRMRIRDKTLVTLLTLPLLYKYGYPITPGNTSKD
jgi:hypothetical protein